MGTVGDGLIHDKGQLGSNAQIKALRQLVSDKSRGGLESLGYFLCVASQMGIKYFGLFQVGSHLSTCNADKSLLNTRVLDLSQYDRHFSEHLIIDAPASVICHSFLRLKFVIVLRDCHESRNSPYVY